ncbi:MAG: outer membrane beta-barrel protein, partial [Chitinophagaceae bacterium]
DEESELMTKRVESILLGLPVHLKFRSDRIGNFRVYMFGGGKIEYDLASNSSSRRAENLVKLKKFDYGIEAGIGFNFYFPVFILSPEIKISNGLLNIHSRDASLKFSNVIDRLNSRMLLFSLIFEG